MTTFLRDADGCLLRADDWLADVWIASAGEWRPWSVDWSAERANEVSREHAAAIAGSDADLDQPAIP